MKYPMKGLVVLVTGGSSGLGKATVEKLHKQGAKVALLSRTRGDEVVKALGRNAIYTPADVTNEDQVKAAIEKVKKQFGRLDVIVNAAGIFSHTKLIESNKELCPLEQIQKIMDVNDRHSERDSPRSPSHD